MTVEPRCGATFVTRHGLFRLDVHADESDRDVCVVLSRDLSGAGRPLVRVHSECMTGDVLGSLRCDCGAQLDMSLCRIAQSRRGALIYVIGHEGRSIGIRDKIRAYALQDAGLDTVEANIALGREVDDRAFDAPARILQDMGWTDVRLLSNNPSKRQALEAHGIVTRLEPLAVPATQHSRAYLEAKRDRLGHWLSLQQEDALSADVVRISGA